MNDYYYNLPMPEEHQRPDQIRQLLNRARRENAMQARGMRACTCTLVLAWCAAPARGGGAPAWPVLGHRMCVRDVCMAACLLRCSLAGCCSQASATARPPALLLLATGCGTRATHKQRK